MIAAKYSMIHKMLEYDAKKAADTLTKNDMSTLMSYIDLYHEIIERYQENPLVVESQDEPYEGSELEKLDAEVFEMLLSNLDPDIVKKNQIIDYTSYDAYLQTLTSWDVTCTLDKLQTLNSENADNRSAALKDLKYYTYALYGFEDLAKQQTSSLRRSSSWALRSSASTYASTVAKNARTGTTYETLASAISAASSGDTIYLMANTSLSSSISIGKAITIQPSGGSYTVTNTGSGVAMFNVTSGGTLTLTGNGSYTLTFSGESLEGSRIVTCNSGGTLNLKNGATLKNTKASAIVNLSGGTVNMSGGTITANTKGYKIKPIDGTGSTAAGEHTTGSGISNAGTLNLSGGTISSNTTYYYGGGIYNSGTLKMTGGTIDGNKAFYGGGIYNAPTGSSTKLTITGGTISNNSLLEGTYEPTKLGHDATSYSPFNGNGGGIWVGIGDASISNCSITGNKGGFGGGIAAGKDGSTSTNTVTLESVTFTGNIAQSSKSSVTTNNTEDLSSGAGAAINTHCKLVVKNCKFKNNEQKTTSGAVSKGNSGAIRAYNTTTVSGSTFESNKSYGGGAVSCVFSGVTATFTNCTFKNNTVSNDPGGVFYIANGATVVLSGGTMSGNDSGTYGEAIYQDGTLKISGNTAIDTSNDVYLSSGKFITVTGQLTKSSGTIARITPNEYTLGRKCVEVAYGKKLGSLEYAYSSGTPKFTLTPKGDYTLRPGDYIDASANIADSNIVISTKYDVTYNKNTTDTVSNLPGNGSSYWKENYTISSTKPTRSGYTFKNWNTKADGSGTSYNSGASLGMLTADVTLYAMWTAAAPSGPSGTYTVKYNGNGNTGGSTASSTHTIGVAKNLTKNGFTKTGYTFKGWSKSSSSSTVSYRDQQSVTNLSTTNGATVNLYAVWEQNAPSGTYTVKYNGNGNTGGSTASSTHTIGVAKNLTKNGFTKTGYTFKGWSKSSSSSTVSYRDQQSVTNLSTTNGATVNLYAVWEQNAPSGTYTVKYNGNGNTGGSTASSTHTIGVAKNLTKNGFTKTGYTFKGWSKSSSSSTVSYRDQQSVTNLSTTNGATVNLYAVWSPITYTVKYNGNGNTGGSTASSTHTYGVSKALTRNGFTKTNCTFRGWSTSSSSSTVTYTDGESVTNLSTTNGATVNLYAVWAENAPSGTYTVKYNGNGNTGGSTASSTHTIGVAKNLTKNGFTKTGYTFKGWSKSSTSSTVTYTDQQSVTNLSTTNGATVNLYAVWSPITYTVRYNGNGSTSGSTASSTHTYNLAKTLTQNGFTRIGYTFMGWSTSSSSSTVTYTDKQSVKNLTTTNGATVNLYAVWEENTPDTYTVVYNGNGNTGGSTASSIHTIGVAKNLTKNGFTKTGYTFKGWSKSSSSSTVSYRDQQSVTDLSTTPGATVNLYAVWSPITYTVKYNGNGNTSGSTASSSHTYGIAKTLTANGFVRTGYTFKGWSTSSSSTTVTYTDQQSVSNLTTTNGAIVNLYAVWNPITYTVKYNGNGNTGGSTASSTHTYDVAKALTANGFTKTGYTFQYWNTKSDGSGTSYANNASVKNLTTTNGATVNLYAIWAKNAPSGTYTVKYNGNGNTGGSTASSTHTIGVAKNLTKNGFTKTGYTFQGWSTSSSSSTVTYTDQQSVTNLSTTNGATVNLYAVWSPITYTVKYNGNGSTSGSTASSTHTYGVAKNLTANGFVKTGYTFKGWSTSSSSTTVSYTDRQSVTNLASTNGATVNLYAVWEVDATANTYTVVYNGNGNTGGSTASSTHTIGVAKNLTKNGFTKTGYRFAGWSKYSWYNTVSYTDQQSVTNLTTTAGATVTLYAVWEQETTIATYTVKYNGNGNTGGSTASSTHTVGVAKNLTKNGFTKTGYTFKGWSTSMYSSTVSYTDQQSVTNLSTTDGATVNLYAVWAANGTYTVKYNGNGNTGGSTASSTHTIGVAKALTANGFTKTGYIFQGWSTSSSSTTVAYTDQQSVTNLSTTNGATVNLYAVWSPITYTVKYNGNGNTSGSTVSSTHTYGVAKNLTANGFVKTGYTFKGWSTSSSSTTVSYTDRQSVTNLASTNGATVNLYAVWEVDATANTYTVVYNGNGNTGGSTASSTHTIGVAKNLTKNGFTKTGYRFAGWSKYSWYNTVSYTDQQSVTNLTTTAGATVTLYAVWEQETTIATYTVKYNGNGNTGGSTASSTHTVGVAKNLTKNGFTKTGYTFKGWSTSMYSSTVSYTDQQSVTNLSTTDGATVNLYAVWEHNKETVSTYTVVYNGNGNTGGYTASSTHTVGVAKSLTRNGFTRTGYTFAGWNTSYYGNGTSYADGEIVTNLATTNGATVTLYAQWTPITYTVVYNGNGNIGGVTASSIHTYDVSKALTKNGYTKTGYTFKCWNTKADGSGTSYANQASVKNLTATDGATVTLYAQWTSNITGGSYTIIYDGNGATEGSTASSVHEIGVSKRLTKNGYLKKSSYTNGMYTWYAQFRGWNTKADGSGDYYMDEASVLNLSTTDGDTITLYAQWYDYMWSSGYTVFYNGNGSTGGFMKPDTFQYRYGFYGQPQYLTKNAFVRTGYTFKNWNKNADGTGKSYEDEAEAVNLVAYSYMDYMKPKNVTLYAQWTPITYTVHYNGNGATSGSTADSTHTYDIARTLTANGFAKTGYMFAGWNTEADGSGTSYANSETVLNLTAENGAVINLYAQWTPISYTVKYNGNGATSGTMANSVHIYDVAKTLTPNAFARTGYTFKYWNTKADGTGTTYENGASVKNLATTNGATVTLYAQWSVNTYTVKYNGNGATSGSTASSTHTYNVEKYLTANGYSRTGYLFQGWNTKADGSGTPYADKASVVNLTTENGATVILYAQWKANTYVVEYHGNGATSGTMPNSVHTVGVAKALNSNTFARTGYMFKNWNTNADGSGTTYQDGASVTDLTTAGSTIRLYAQWIPITYTVSYNGNGNTGGSTASSSHTYDATKALTLNGYTRTGYTFAFWNTKADGSGTSYENQAAVKNLTSTNGATITLYAQWEPKAYIIMYDGNGNTGGSMRHSTHTYDVAQNLTPNAFTRTGYVFKNWNTEADGSGTAYADNASVKNLTPNLEIITLYAQWTPITYTVAYNGNGNTSGSTTSSTHTYDVAKTLTANGFAKTGSTFKCWNTKADGTGTTYADRESVKNLTTTNGATVTLYAQWTSNTYTVVYDGNGATGGSTASSTHTYGVEQNLTANGYTRTGYTFKNWNTAADGSGTSYENSASVINLTATKGATVTLYAQWTANTYTITYNGNGSTSGSTASSTHTYNVAKNLTANGFARTGYVFTHWNTKADGSGDSYANSASVKNLTATNGATITLYAQWEPITYTVKYDGNGSTSGSTANSSHIYDVAKTLTANGYARTGYTFKNWNTKADGSGTSYENSASVKNLAASDGAVVTLYAQWTANIYTITYNSNKPSTASGAISGTTADSSHTYDVAKQLTANGYSLTGWTFTGWNTKADGSGDSYENSASVKNLTATNGSTIVLYAQWRANAYTVSYNSNKPAAASGTISGTTASSSHTYDVAKNLTANGYSLTGWTFAGWNTKADGSGKAYADKASVKNLTATNGATITLYAQWEVNTYTVFYNSNRPSAASGSISGTTASSSHTYDVAKTLTANGYSLTGWTFTGWNTKADGSGTAYANQASVKNLTDINGATVTLYAQWTANTYTVTYNSNKPSAATGTISGTTANSTHTYDTAKALTANGYSLTGWTFDGWNTKADGSGTGYGDGESVINLTTTKGATVTLYAQWSINAYYLDLNGYLDGVSSGNIKGYGTADVYVDGVQKANDVTDFYQKIPYGSSYEIKDIKALTGHTYGGVYSGSLTGTMDVGNKSVSLKFITNQYTVVFDKNGGSGTMSNQSFVYGTAQDLIANTYTRTGYTFTGWNTAANGSGTAYADQEAVNNLTDTNGATVTLYAQWRAHTYTVTYDRNKPSNATATVSGTTADSTHTYDVAKNLTTNGYSLTGWTFTGWNTKADGSGTAYENGANVKNLASANEATVTLYAQWRANTYTVTYNSNKPSTASGTISGSTANSSHTYDVSKNLTANGYSLTGWTFTSWNTKADGSGTTYANQASVKNLATSGTVTLYAQWRANTYTVTYNSNKPSAATGTISGTTVSSNHTYDVAKNLTANGYSLTGWTFAGWNTKADGSGTAYANNASVKNLTAISGATVTLYAQWASNQYQLTLHPNHGSFADGTTVAKTLSPNLVYDGMNWWNIGSNSVSRTGYIFDGWYDAASGGEKVYDESGACVNGTYWQDNHYKHTGSLTVYAHWIAKKVVVTFHRNTNASDTTTAQQTFTYDVSGQSFSDKGWSKTGYTLLGWSADQNATSATYTILSGVTNAWIDAYSPSIDLYAVWQANTYTVKYDGNGNTGGSTASSSHTYDVAKNLTANGFTKDGYRFKNWNTIADGSGTTYADRASVKNLTSKAGGTVTLYAQWTPIEYTVTFNGNGATSGSTASQSYTFDTSKALTANGFVRKYTVTFDANGGTGSTSSVATATFNGWEDRNSIVYKGTTYAYTTFDAPYYSNTYSDLKKAFGYNKYKLLNHYINNGKSEGRSPVGSSAGLYPNQASVSNLTTTGGATVTLYANWTLGTVTLPTPSRTGYTFAGWYDANGNQVTGTSYTPTADTTLTAHWTANTYTVTYNSNKPSNASGTISGTTANSSHTYDVAKNLTANGYSLTGWTFTGWNTKADGSGKAYADRASVVNLASANGATVTLYAQWRAHKYTIEYKGNGNTGGSMASTIHTYDTAKTLTANGFTKTGYTFVKWITNEDGTGNSYADKESVKNLTATDNGKIILYAQWKANTYTVKYDGNGATEGSTASSTHTYDTAKALTLNGFKRTHWLFKCWNTKANGSGTSYSDGETVKNLTSVPNGTVTLYAQWTPKPWLTVEDQNYYEGQQITKAELLSHVTATDPFFGDLTAKVEIVRIEYASGKLLNYVDATGQPQTKRLDAYTHTSFPDSYMLDTWGNQMEENSQVQHQITFRVSNEYGIYTYATAKINVKANNAPKLDAVDQYFTLEEAQNGVITEKELLEDSIADGRVKAEDDEEGNLSDRIVIKDFDPDVFTSMDKDGYVDITYEVTDTFGPGGIGKKDTEIARIYVIDTYLQEAPDSIPTVRFINKTYYEKNKHASEMRITAEELQALSINGGLKPMSLWYEKSDYASLIESTWAKDTGTTYVFDKDEIQAAKDYIEANGIGNTISADGLKGFFDQFLK